MKIEFTTEVTGLQIESRWVEPDPEGPSSLIFDQVKVQVGPRDEDDDSHYAELHLPLAQTLDLSLTDQVRVTIERLEQ